MSRIRGLWAQVRLAVSHFVAAVSPYLQRGQQFAFKYKFPLGAVYLGVCLYFHLYIRLGITAVLVTLIGVSQIPWVKKWRERYAADALVIQGHWERDADLIRLWFYVKCCYGGSLGLIVLFFTALMFEVGVSYNELGFPSGTCWRPELLPLLAFLLSLVGNLLVLAADLHII